VTDPHADLRERLIELRNNLTKDDFRLKRLDATLTEAVNALADAGKLREALRELAGWQPHTETGLDALHPQHREAVEQARAALSDNDQGADRE